MGPVWLFDAPVTSSPQLTPQVQSLSLIQNLGHCRISCEDSYHPMSAAPPKSQRDKALALPHRSGLTRLSKLRRAGITVVRLTGTAPYVAQRITRIQAAVVNDPSLAIGTAKGLCRSVLQDDLD